MIDKRQVMYDIERCISDVPDACRDCSHYTGTVGFECMENLMSDALTLLKGQEPLKPFRGNSGWACSACGNLFSYPQQYCDVCGREVNW